MDVGYKLYQLRRERGLTQAELGRRVGVSEAAIRAYETDKRRPKRVHLERIAEALGIRYEAIADYGVVTVNEAIHSLMRMDDEQWRLRPVKVGERWYLESGDRDISKAIREWGEMRERFEAGEVTQVEYDTWLDSYTPFERMD
jgi:transcriptional regulator with XRE-family HTH domain